MTGDKMLRHVRARTLTVEALVALRVSNGYRVPGTRFLQLTLPETPMILSGAVNHSGFGTGQGISGKTGVATTSLHL